MSDEDVTDLEARYLFIENRWRSLHASNEVQLNAVISMREALDHKKQTSPDMYLAFIKDTVEYMEMSDYYKANGDNN